MFWSQQQEENILNPFTHLRRGYEILVDFLSFLWFYIQNYFWHFLFGALILHYIYKRFLKGVISLLCQKYDRYYERRREEQYAAKYHKNPDVFASRISAQQAIAQKLQEQYYREAREYEEKQKQREASKKEEALRQLGKEIGQDHSLKTEQNEFSKLFEPTDNECPQQGSNKAETILTVSKEEYVKKLQAKYDKQLKEHQGKVQQKEITKKTAEKRGDDQKKSKSLRPEHYPLMDSGGSNYRPVKKSKCPGGGCG